MAMPLCQAQRLPSWMNELPKPGNNTYMYVREAGEGTTLTDGSVSVGGTLGDFTATVTGLQPGTTYYECNGDCVWRGTNLYYGKLIKAERKNRTNIN